MKLTTRDNEIIEFLRTVSVADTTTLNEIFFGNSTRACQRRMKMLVDAKLVKRLERKYINQEYIYYVSRVPKQLEHKLLLSKLICKMHGLGAEIIKVKSPLCVSNIIADGFVVYKIGNTVRMALIEVERSKEFDEGKYIEVVNAKEFKNMFPVRPLIIIVSDNKPVNMDLFKIINIKTDFSNIENII
ncbi:hypothetical protein ACQQ2T_15450 (plasmid) [Paraclostridium tenue]